MHESFDLAQGVAGTPHLNEVGAPTPTPTQEADPDRARAAADVRDRALVDRISRGDEAAFEHLVRLHRPRLLRIAERIVDTGRAEDAIQNALLKAYQQLRGGDAAPASPSAWLSAIARNAAIDQLRRRGPVDPVAEPLHELRTEATEDVAESRAELRRVLRDVAALPEHEREALLLRATTGAGHEAIGEHLSVSPGQARQLLHRARRRLREVAAVLLPAWLALRFSQGRAAAAGIAAAPSEAMLGGRTAVAIVAAVATIGGGGAAITVSTSGGGGSSRPSAASPSRGQGSDARSGAAADAQAGTPLTPVVAGAAANAASASSSQSSDANPRGEHGGSKPAAANDSPTTGSGVTKPDGVAVPGVPTTDDDAPSGSPGRDRGRQDDATGSSSGSGASEDSGRGRDRTDDDDRLSGTDDRSGFGSGSVSGRDPREDSGTSSSSGSGSARNDNASDSRKREADDDAPSTDAPTASAPADTDRDDAEREESGTSGTSGKSQRDSDQGRSDDE